MTKRIDLSETSKRRHTPPERDFHGHSRYVKDNKRISAIMFHLTILSAG